MNDYTVYYGIEELHRINTAVSICFDTETTQLQPEKGGLRLLQLGCTVSKTIVVIDCFQLEDDDWIAIDRFFNNGERFWLAHNAVFDVGWLQEHDIYIRGSVRCSFIASRLLTNGIAQVKHGLDAVARRHLNIEVVKEQQLSDWSAPELTKEQLEYAAKDVEVLCELDSVIHKKLAVDNLIGCYSLECNAIPAMAQMWRTGLPWNKKAMDQLLEDYENDAKEMSKEFIRELNNALPEDNKLPREETKEVIRYREIGEKLTKMGSDVEDRKRWYEELEELKPLVDMAPFNLRAKSIGSKRLGTKKYAGFNINSPKQLMEKLEYILGFIPLNNEGKPSASRQALRKYAADHVIIQKYLEWKKTEKRRQMLSSIKEKMKPDGFVRASYMQLGADTGRMSCIKPNNQQIPRDPSFRQCVEAPEGWKIVDADFSQMELRLAAAIAGDPKMASIFREGSDIHEQTALSLNCSRQIAKSANFGLLYGAGAEGLRNYAGANGVTITIEQAEKVRNDWLNTYSGIKRWQINNQIISRKTEKEAWPETRIPKTNMRRFLKGDLNKVTVRCNTPIQGAGAAILKLALVKLWEKVKQAGEDDVRIAAAVHDEILLLVRDRMVVKQGSADEKIQNTTKWASILKEAMEEAEYKWLGNIPSLAEVSIGKTWSEVH
jgi:DNA polymerase I-like protein with 3'-5' exonuclease and polymerase domains